MNPRSQRKHRFNPDTIAKYRYMTDNIAGTTPKQKAELQAQLGNIINRIADAYKDNFTLGAKNALRYEAITWKHLDLDYFHRIQGTAVGIYINTSELLITTTGIVEGQKDGAIEPWYRWNVQTYIVNPQKHKVRAGIVLSNTDKRKMINVSRAYAQYIGDGVTNHQFRGSLLILEKLLTAKELDWVEAVRENPTLPYPIGQSDLFEQSHSEKDLKLTKLERMAIDEAYQQSIPTDEAFRAEIEGKFDVIDESSPMPPLAEVVEAMSHIVDDPYGDEFD